MRHPTWHIDLIQFQAKGTKHGDLLNLEQHIVGKRSVPVRFLNILKTKTHLTLFYNKDFQAKSHYYIHSSIHALSQQFLRMCHVLGAR